MNDIDKTQKKDIAEIHPLSFMQQTLLMHFLHEKYDQGFLQIKCKLSGKINSQLLKKSFITIFEHHKALRASIHWENISNPVQVVHSNIEIPWIELDWSSHNNSRIVTLLEDLLKKDRTKGLEFTKAPLSRIYLIKLKDEDYFLIWTCHHILVDGWSSFYALSEILQTYESLLKNRKRNFTSTASYYDHLNWIKNQDTTTAKIFWKSILRKHDSSCLISKQKNSFKKGLSFKSVGFNLSVSQSDALRLVSQKLACSLNAIFQGFWALLLCRYLNIDQVLFGITTNGRTATGLRNAEEVVGMFMNVLPFPVSIDRNISLSAFMKQMQSLQLKVLEYEYLSLGDILEYINGSGKALLYDTLLIYQNFPEFQLKSAGIEIVEYESSATTTFPITIIITPKDIINLTIKYNASTLVNESPDRFLELFEKLVDLMISNNEMKLFDVFKELDFQESDNAKVKLYPADGEHPYDSTMDAPLREENVYNYHLTRNTDLTELVETIESNLCLLWEQVFGWGPIGREEDFFDIGGTSIMALVLINKINTCFQKKYSAALILTHPTIKLLSSIIADEIHEGEKDLIVSLKKSDGEKKIFFLHSTSGQLLFYRNLLKKIKTESFIYGIQGTPKGEKLLESKDIAGLAKYYIQEIRKIQSTGPFAILSYCFTNSIALEMAHQLRRAGDEVRPLIIIDAKPVGVDLEPLSLKEKVFFHAKLLFKGEFYFIFSNLKYKVRFEKQRIFNNKRKEQLKTIKSPKTVNKFEELLIGANMNYKIQEYPGGLIYIQSNELQQQDTLKRIYKTWFKITRGKLEKYTFKGDHISFFVEKNSGKFARMIEQIIN